MPESHSLMDGKLHVYRRENSRFWQCATYLSGRNYRQTTKETNIAFAREFAREWYLDRVAEDRLRKSGKLPAAPETSIVIPARVAPKRPGEKTFREAAAVFEKEFEAMTLGERNTHYVVGKGRVIRLYLNPFFGDLPISEVSAGRIQDYRLHRVTPPDEPQRVRFVSDGQERIGKAKADQSGDVSASTSLGWTIARSLSMVLRLNLKAGSRRQRSALVLTWPSMRRMQPACLHPTGSRKLTSSMGDGTMRRWRCGG